jgi:hypothetical protein
MDRQEHKVERRLIAIFAADEPGRALGLQSRHGQNRTIVLLYWPSSGKTLPYAKAQKISPIAD